MFRSVMILLCLCIVRPVVCEEGVPLDVTVYPGQLVVGVEWQGAVPYFNTAILFHAEDDKNYFFTNANLPPADAETQLLARGMITSEELFPAKALGAAPGYDIAIFEVARDKRVKVTAQQLNDLVEQLLFKEADRGPFHMGILNYLGSVFDGRLNWEDLFSIELLSDWATWKMPESKKPPDVKEAKRLSERAEILRLIPHHCPALFLDNCLAAGFQQAIIGGVLIGAKKREFDYTKESAHILGLMMEDKNLNGKPKTIPAAVGLRVAKRLLETYKQKGQYHLETVDETGAFEWVSPSEFKILATGERVRSRPFHMPEQTQFALAEGKDPIATFKARTRYGFFVGNECCAAGLAKMEELQEEASAVYAAPSATSKPGAFWNTTGPTVLLNALNADPFLKHAVPVLISGAGVGVRAPGAEEKPVLQCAEKPVYEPRDLRLCLQKNPKAVLASNVPKESLPTTLGLSMFSPSGVMTTGYIAKLRPYSKISKEDLDGATNHDIIFSRMAEQMSANKDPLDRLDPIIVSAGPSLSGTVTTASFTRINSEVRLKLFTHRFGSIEIQFEDNFLQEGFASFRYKGPAYLREKMLLEGYGASLTARAVARLRWNEELKNYVLDLVVAVPQMPVKKPEELKNNGFAFMNWTIPIVEGSWIFFQHFQIPLEKDRVEDVREELSPQEVYKEYGDHLLEMEKIMKDPKFQEFMPIMDWGLRNKQIAAESRVILKTLTGASQENLDNHLLALQTQLGIVPLADPTIGTLQKLEHLQKSLDSRLESLKAGKE